MSDGIDELGTLRWQLVVSLLAAWIFIFLALCKGVKSSGKASSHTVVNLTWSPWVVTLSWHGHAFGAGNVPGRESSGRIVWGMPRRNVWGQIVRGRMSGSSCQIAHNLCQPG